MLAGTGECSPCHADRSAGLRAAGNNVRVANPMHRRTKAMPFGPIAFNPSAMKRNVAPQMSPGVAISNQSADTNHYQIFVLARSCHLQAAALAIAVGVWITRRIFAPRKSQIAQPNAECSPALRMRGDVFTTSFQVRGFGKAPAGALPRMQKIPNSPWET
jgi:hypothetical protein